MTTTNDPRPAQAADVSIRIGKSVAFDASISAAGLLSVGALVSGILLSSAAIVLASRRGRVTALPIAPAPDRQLQHLQP